MCRNIAIRFVSFLESKHECERIANMSVNMFRSMQQCIAVQTAPNKHGGQCRQGGLASHNDQCSKKGFSGLKRFAISAQRSMYTLLSLLNQSHDW